MKVQNNMYVRNTELIKENFEKKENAVCSFASEDNITISDSAKKLAMAARDKVSEFCAMRFSSICGQIKEIPAEYRCENLFKLELKATSISGGRSIFEGYSENQAMIFGKWIDENVSEYLSEDETNGLKEQVRMMVSGVDELNSQEGYRGTSFESVFLLGASEAGLRKINEVYVPKQLQSVFSEMIDEYVHFNESARNSIMERMTPDYMVVGIGNKSEAYKYKSEIISDEHAFYRNEKAVIKDLCNQFLDGETDSNSYCKEMKGYLKDYYKGRWELGNQIGSVDTNVEEMFWMLQEMYGDVL